jgi:ABC-type transport system involved in cytochrome c biogenesis permease subunit
MKSLLDYLKYGIVGLAALYLVSGLFPRKYPATEMQIDVFAAQPVVDGGRTKPWTSVAEVNLMAISGRRSYKEGDGKSEPVKKQPAIKWLLDLMTSEMYPYPAEVATYKIFRVEDPLLLAALGLESRRELFAFAEFETKLTALYERAQQAARAMKDQRLPEKEEHLYAKAIDLLSQTDNVLGLARGPSARAKVFHIENDQLLGVLGLEQRKGFQYALVEFLPKWSEFLAQVDRVKAVDDKKRDLFDRKVMDLWSSLGIYQKYAHLGGPHAIPPVGREGGEWLTFRDGKKVGNPYVAKYKVILEAYAAGEIETFNEGVKDLAKDMGSYQASASSSASTEVVFNHFSPFEKCAALYGVVFVLTLISFLLLGLDKAAASENVRDAAFWLAVFVAIVHTIALMVRISLTGRPPVTNLYSSAVFIGWGCVLLCLVLEYLFPKGLGTLVASVLGGLTLIVAHNLAASGDTMEVLVAVLDTNFWLATHVVCITMGYTATFVAGFLGLVYVVMGVFTRGLDREMSQILTKMIYGVVCFATLLSFTGTVLGGIWADQSWGRFWGWDPKENGALIIVLWNALLLHARWGGLAKSRGIALLAIGGNIVTAWSWFGVNMLGVGLHNYGFMPGHLFWMLTFVGSMLLLIGIGNLPEKYWKSLNAPAPVFSPAAAVKPTLDLTNGSAAPATAIAAAPVMTPRKAKNKVKVKK